MRQGTQIQVIDGKIAGRTFTRPTDLSNWCRFNNPGEARRDVMLKLIDLLERTVKAVGMRAGFRFDQLRVMCTPVPIFAHGAL